MHTQIIISPLGHIRDTLQLKPASRRESVVSPSSLSTWMPTLFPQTATTKVAKLKMYHYGFRPRGLCFDPSSELSKSITKLQAWMLFRPGSPDPSRLAEALYQANPPPTPSPLDCRCTFCNTGALGDEVQCGLTVPSPATPRLKFPVLSRVQLCACVCFYDTRIRSLLAMVSVPSCRRPSEQSPVFRKQEGRREGIKVNNIK